MSSLSNLAETLHRLPCPSTGPKISCDLSLFLIRGAGINNYSEVSNNRAALHVCLFFGKVPTYTIIRSHINLDLSAIFCFNDLEVQK